MTLAAGEAAQIVISQPVDMEIELRNGASSITFDSFEFGPETIAIVAAGDNQLEVRPVAGALRRPAALLMSRTPLPLPKAVALREAESQATSSKHSANPSDVTGSLRLWQELNAPSAVGRTWLKLGDALLSAGNLASSRAAYESALTVCRAAGYLRCTAEAANNSGTVAQQQGEFDASLARLTEAAQDWQSLGDALSQGQTFSNMGLLFRQIGDFQRGISFFDRASRTLPSDEILANARVLSNLGFCYQSLAEYDRAQSYFERALAAESPLSGVAAHDRVRTRLNLGRNLMLEGYPQRALLVLQRTLAEANALADRQAVANSLNNLGQAYLAANRISEALKSLEAALTLHKTLGSNPMIASDLHYLGEATLSNGDIDAARQLFIQALSLRRASSLRDLSSNTLYSLATLERKAGNIEAASGFIEQALSILETVRTEVPGPALRASYYAQKRRFFDLLVDIALVPTNPRAAEDGLLAAERGHGRALLDMLAEGAVFRSFPEELTKRRKTIQRQIDLLSLRLTAAPDRESELRQKVESLVAEDEKVEASIGQGIKGQNMGRPLESIQQLQHDILPANAALLEFHLGPDCSYLWLVDSARIQVFSLPARNIIETQSRRAVNLFGDILDRRRFPEKQAQFQRAMRHLSQTLLGSLSSVSLPARLIIVPDGILGRVPFAALTPPSTSAALGLTHDLIQVPAAAFLTAGNAPRPVSSFPKALIALADPVFSSRDPRVASAPERHESSALPLITDLPRLPFFAEIDAAISRLPPSKRLILEGFDASPGNLRKINLKEYGILHFSTHSFIDDRIPELSRIALSMVDRSGRPVNGFLRPYFLAELRFNGSTVVLSACNTALGKEVIGEGLAGLTATLFHAGAAQLLLTLTEIDAEGSSEFLKTAYTNVFSSQNISMEHSLTLARIALSRSKRWSDPYYWASFVLFGRPTRGKGQKL